MHQVMILFIPVTVSIGIINIDSFLNATLGTLVSPHASIAINDAFRLYMLPQGIFSVAVTTVLFPTLTRMAIGRDVERDAPHARQRCAPDQPAADPVGGADGRAGHPDRPARLPARPLQHRLDGPGLHRAAVVRVQPAVLRVNLLFTRTFFALKRPWIPTRLAAMNVALDIVVSLALYKPLGHRRPDHRHACGQHLHDLAAGAAAADRLQRPPRGSADADDHRPDLVATAITTAVGYFIWKGLDSLLGLSLVAQILSVGIALLVAGAVYFRLVLLMRIPEARQIEALVRSRLPGR